MKNYKVSIVTPYHNVGMNMFRKAFESMINQTYGLDNIQWIIVVHNSDDKHLNAVLELVKGYDSIEVYTLKDDVHSPSSPRNYGMKFASGKYLGFLDADDSFTPACIETALKHIEATNSQMVVFRLEYELENSDCFPLLELTLWNQTLDEIVMERGHWDKEKMFDVAWGYITLRMFDRQFLVQENIKFCDDIPFGEDQYFSAMVYGKIDRICYLPNFIGYHYFINSSSTVQSKGTKSGETCVGYARGFNKIFSLAMYYEIPIDPVVHVWSNYLVMCIMGSPDITFEQIKQISDIMRPYAKMIEPLKPSKIFSQAEIDVMYAASQKLMYPEEIYSEKYAHDDNTLEVVNDKYKLLARIVKDNSSSDILQKYDLKDYADFMEKAPLTSYGDYAPWIKLTTKSGEKNIFTLYPILCYALTSGSMGQPKYIPCTQQHIEDFIAEFIRILDNKRSFVMFESMPRVFTNDGAYIDTIGGITLEYFAKENPKLAEKFIALPSELLLQQNILGTIYTGLIFALKDKSVKQIIAPFTWNVEEMFEYIEKNWVELCNNIEAGEIPSIPQLNENVREALNNKLTSDKERANELREIFEQGFNEPIAPKIWPMLDKIIAAGTGAFEIYTDNMCRYTGNIPHSNGIYAASEALIARAEEDESNKYVICPEYGFFEFVNPGEDKPLTFDKLEAGKSYEIIVTNKSGLYRYKLEDIVTIVNADKLAPVITFNCKTGQHGIVMTEHDIYCALKDVVSLFNIDIADFAYWLDKEAKTWIVFIEPFKRSLDSVMKADVKRISETFNQRLEQINLKYSRLLNVGKIKPCELKFSQPETHLRYRDVECYRQKTIPGQIKPVHFIDKNEDIKRFFMENILDL